MVANAGICPLNPLVESPLFCRDVSAAYSLCDKASSELLDKAMAVNVRGTMLCYKYAAQQMIAQGRGGRIVGTLLSMSGFQRTS